MSMHSNGGRRTPPPSPPSFGRTVDSKPADGAPFVRSGKALAPTITGSMFAAMTQQFGTAAEGVDAAPAASPRPLAASNQTTIVTTSGGASTWPWDEHLPFYFVSALCVVALLLSMRFEERRSLRA